MSDDNSSNNNNNNEDDGGSSTFLNTNLLIVVWVVSFMIFLCTPFLVSKYRRTLWWKRIQLCQWHVYVEPDRDPEWYRIAMERYEVYRERAAELDANGARRQLTKQEEEEVRQLFLLERMASFTMDLKADFIRGKAQVEAGDFDVVDTNNCDLEMSSKASASVEDVVASDIEEGIQGVKETTTNTEGPSVSPDADIEGLSIVEVEEAVPQESPAAPTDIEEGVAVGVEKNRTRAGSDASSSDDEAAEIDLGVMEEATTFIGVPYPGEALMGQTKKVRFVPNGCAICLCEFEAGERVTWSATKGDPHVFHEDCMMNYYLSVGAKASRHRRRHPEDQDPNQDPAEAATDFPMLCPCCRQQFVSKVSPTLPDESDDDEDPKDSVPSVPAVAVDESTIIDNSDNTGHIGSEAMTVADEEETPSAATTAPQLAAAELV